MKYLAATVLAMLAFGSAAGANGIRATQAQAPEALAGCGSNLETWFAPEGNGYAGGAAYVIEFSNIGKTTCTVRGYPTITLTANGRQVGLASRHDPLILTRTITLKRGKTAHVVLLVTDAGAVCRPVKTNGLRVRVPGASQSSVFPFMSSGACPGKSTLQVDAINPGVGIPYYTIR